MPPPRPGSLTTASSVPGYGRRPGDGAASANASAAGPSNTSGNLESFVEMVPSHLTDICMACISVRLFVFIS